MTAGFGSLYYTDCLPGQGLTGRAGFQFQAATPGPAGDATHVVQRAALYEPPAVWMRERRPVVDYPRSLAHTAEEGFLVTAAGRYLGQEANGTRQGNQFTHAVVTRLPADYGAVRPAQLWGAPWWADAPAAGTTLPALPPDPAPGPLDVETVRDRIDATEGGEELLTALVSAVAHLVDPDRRRTVVLVTTDPERAACWLAAATLLLPRPQALQVSFKIFVSDPRYARHDVVALHPEWAGQWADTRADSGLAVLDLDRGRCSTVETTTSAAFWVPRFLRDDPYDIVDAVELAGQFAAARSREEHPPTSEDATAPPGEPTVADRLVALLVATGAPLRDRGDVEAVAGWLQTAPEEAVPIAREPALEAVLATVPAAGVLRTLAEAAGDRHWEDAVVHRVLDGLLASELVEAAAGEGVAALRTALAHGPLHPPARADADRSAVRAQVEAALDAAAPDHVPALLVTARRHGVRPVTNAFAAAADRFARWWLACPDDALTPQRWDAPAEALDWVRDALHADLVADDRTARDAVAAVRERWWGPLLPDAADPTDVLDGLVWSSAYPHLAGDRAARLRAQVIDACARTWPGPSTSTAVWRILHRFTASTPAAARRIVDDLDANGIPLSPDVAETIMRDVGTERVRSADGLALLDVVERQGHPLPPALAEQVAADRVVREVVEDLPRPKPVHGAAELAARIGRMPARLREIRLPALVAALLAARPERAAAVLSALEKPMFLAFAEALERCWPQPGSPATPDQGRAAALVFVVTAHEHATSREGDFVVLRNNLRQHVGALGKDERAAIFRALPRAWQSRWTTWLRDVDPSLLRRLGKMTNTFRADPEKREG
jgi:hypothetical protein